MVSQASDKDRALTRAARGVHLQPPRAVASLALCLVFVAGAVPTWASEAFLGTGSYAGPYWPTLGWRSCQPEEVGLDSVRLQLVFDYVADPALDTRGLLVVKDGYVVGEAYLGGFAEDSRHDSWSMAKSVAGALVGIAIDRGLIGSVDEEAYRHFAEWQRPDTSPAKRRITIRHLLTMTAGLEWREDERYTEPSQDDIYQMVTTSRDYIAYVLAKPMAVEPGTRWYYSTGESILLSGILESATGLTAQSFAREQLFAPLGMTNLFWESDPAGHTVTGWGIEATVRDFAKIGYLYLNDGEWDGRQIVSSSWVAESTRPISEEWNHYGYLWWLPYAYESYREAGTTERSFMAAGAFVQRIVVIPEHEIVAVRVGHDPPADDLGWSTAEFIRLIQDAVVEPEP